MRTYSGLLVLFIMLTACVGERKTPAPVPLPPIETKAPAESPKPAPLFQRVSVCSLPGFMDDKDLPLFLEAFSNSCKVIQAKNSSSRLGVAGKAGEWKPVCEKVLELSKDSIPPATEVRRFLETSFDAYLVTDQGNPEGLFTGYYAPELRGALTQKGDYQYPVYGMPSDMIIIEDLGKFRESLKGEKIAGKLNGNKLEPYHDRKAIESNGLKAPILAWVDDPVDLFFLHIQGSGQIRLEDGKLLRVGYAGQNGHVYYPIGRHLVEIEGIQKEHVSMQTIKAWLRDHADLAQRIMHKNPSFVFFRILEGKGPVGGGGVPLTPGRSLAVDFRIIPYHVPIWVDIAHPTVPGQRIQRLMVAQDTGGAIRGVVRADFFWGAGEEAEVYAGEMKSKGSFYMLLPKSVSPLP